MNTALAITLGLLSLFALLLLVFEKSKTDEKLIAVVAALGTLAAVLRIPFAAIPNVQPTTFLVMISGYVFGVRAGFLTGVMAALLSNVYLGHGPWTLWQMLAWGLGGALSGGLRKWLEPRTREGTMLATRHACWLFLLVCTVWGVIFGWIMNLSIFVTLGPFATWPALLALYARSMPFDLAHAAGNLCFAALFSRDLARILQRYHRKLTVSRLSRPEGGAS